ncbi:MFS transporter [Clostridium sp. 'White wine YQ']|uniref:MFS transporter n=1 Tax=Clostridium sp. 'White wine YQ' TaxID=3027474 RepID=UPI00236623AA|nr:MFS transporter [Clostridium sp. 'White wine YQ']MDD7793136.1 MFS transporter [Clostridium sp. 'White wine YQ']
MSSKRNFLLYIIGRFISYIGTGIQQIALPLYILDITHSGIMMGLFSILNLVPNLITLPFAGILGDRKNRRNIMVATDLGRGIIVCLLGTLALTGNINIYILFSAQIFISIMDSIFGGSSTALLPELVSEESLMKATSTRGGLDAASMIVGPALGGIIYGLMGIKAVFYINAVSFIISGVLSAFIIYENKIYNKGKITLKSFLSENLETLTFIKDNKGIMQLFGYAMMTNLLLTPSFDIVLPYIMKKGIGFSSEQFGYLMSIFTLGVLVGNVVLGLGAKKAKTKNIMNLSFIMQSVMLFGFSIVIFPKQVSLLGGHSWILFMVIALICVTIGGFNAGVNTPISTNLQKMVPNEMRARFFSLIGMIAQGAVPLGSIMYGILLDRFHYYNIFMIVTILNSVITLIFIFKAVPEVYEPKVQPILEN